MDRTGEHRDGVGAFGLRLGLVLDLEGGDRLFGGFLVSRGSLRRKEGRNRKQGLEQHVQASPPNGTGAGKTSSLSILPGMNAGIRILNCPASPGTSAQTRSARRRFGRSIRSAYGPLQRQVDTQEITQRQHHQEARDK